mmetsp:Transcript_19799/g.29177  ORF Transcript_19799/g.29177 Transcript_19799/m.29177 type:complete len:131 (+) Transcript_19799:1-393(+)
MVFRVIPLGGKPLQVCPAPKDEDPVQLKVASSTQPRELQEAMLVSWYKRCQGKHGDVSLAPMNSDNIAKAVKSTGFALREMRQRQRSQGLRPFLLVPRITTVTQKDGKPGTVTFLDLELQPPRGSKPGPE